MKNKNLLSKAADENKAQQQQPLITRLPGEPLTMPNFWQTLYDCYPNSVKTNFCKWIDEYKARNNWNYLFGTDTDGVQHFRSLIKFHDLPLAMQIGILIEFLQDNDAIYIMPEPDYALNVDTRVPNWVEMFLTNLVNYFKEEHEEAEAEHDAEREMSVGDEDEIFDRQ